MITSPWGIPLGSWLRAGASSSSYSSSYYSLKQSLQQTSKIITSAAKM